MKEPMRIDEKAVYIRLRDREIEKLQMKIAKGQCEVIAWQKMLRQLLGLES